MVHHLWSRRLRLVGELKKVQLINVSNSAVCPIVIEHTCWSGTAGVNNGLYSKLL